MKNKSTLKYWKKKAKNNPNEKTVKVNAFNDYSELDANFIMRFADTNTDILDLASGTGLIINKLLDKVHSIVAIEFFEEFSKFIQSNSNVTIINQDIKVYEPSSDFDLVTIFGASQYFSFEEIEKIYIKCFNCTKKNGKIIVKNQFGIREDVLVSGYSEELKEDYFSHYRHLDSEVKLLEKTGYKNIEVFDIYPPEANRWSNTHFYAIVAEK
ncbi:MAG: class I SAM-dependent methyltransferase [Prevotellaceae bacterium]|jgi:cyclopropane fatty-acyl-phospholipid synthase-like methyltransferase|nr:class I SAM-dependent methyltransferase [Prevotellaceae bacterium]